MRPIEEVRELERHMEITWREKEADDYAAEIVRDTLRWVTGEDTRSVTQFAEFYLQDGVTGNEGKPKLTISDAPPEQSTE